MLLRFESVNQFKLSHIYITRYIYMYIYIYIHISGTRISNMNFMEILLFGRDFLFHHYHFNANPPKLHPKRTNTKNKKIKVKWSFYIRIYKKYCEERERNGKRFYVYGIKHDDVIWRACKL